jgi:hypothetical protein
MTDRFVPTEPGLYWFQDVNGPNTAEIDNRGDVWIAGSEIAQDKDKLDWIAPVPQLNVVREMREALEPFAEYGTNNVDDDGWTGPMSHTRIVDWFGPSDFRRARAAIAKLGKGGA